MEPGPFMKSGDDANAVTSLWRRGRVGRALLLIPLAALVVALWVLFDKPAHTYQVIGNSSTWSADVRVAVSRGVHGSPIAATGALHHLPGVGTIKDVIVETGSSHRLLVIFLRSEGWNENGLAYLQGYPPPQDTCNVHLSGPWWQIGSLNTKTMGCAQGFHFTPGG